MRAALLAIASLLVFPAWAQTHDRLVGTWKLVSVSSSTTSGERNDSPFGPRPAGFLTYTQDRMTAMISYGGRYTLNGDKVIHHVEISSIQNWVDTDLIRSIKFEGDRIVLVTPPTSVDGKIQTFELIWQRLPANSR